jgi:hypothetical protein
LLQLSWAQELHEFTRTVQQMRVQCWSANVARLCSPKKSSQEADSQDLTNLDQLFNMTSLLQHEIRSWWIA